MLVPDRLRAAERWLMWFLLAVVLALALGLRLYRLGAQSFWLDEAYTYLFAVLDPPRMIAWANESGHVPTYFLFMHYWLALGDDEHTLRLPSAIFGVLTVAATFGLGRVAGGNRVGLIAALLVVLAPMQVHYAQEARMYTMYTLAATAALTGLVYLLKHPEQAAVPLWRASAWKNGNAAGRARRHAWLAFIAGTVVVLYLHNLGTHFLATCWLFALVLVAVSAERRWAVIANWTLANLAVLAAWSFRIRTVLDQSHRLSSDDPSELPTWPAIRATLRDLYTYSYGVPWLEALLVVLVALGVIALRRDLRIAAGLIVAAFAPVGLALVGSLARPTFEARYILWAAIPCCTLMAAGVFAVRVRGLNYALIGLLLFGGYTALARYYRHDRKPPWREIAHYLHEHDDGTTRILTSGSQERTALSYYWKRSDPIPSVRTNSLNSRNGMFVLRQAWGYHRVWIVDYKSGRRRATKLARRVLDARVQFEGEQRFGTVVIYSYDLTRPRWDF
jgi:uncharacterized membrane protein